MIQDILPRYQERADGTKTAFTVPFDTLSPEYIIAYKDTTRLTASDFTVSGNVVTFNQAPTANQLVTILRVLPIEWTSSSFGALNPEAIVEILSRIVAQIQTLKEEVSRSVKTRPYDEENGESLSDYFLGQMQQSIDVLEQFQQLSEDLTALKTEVDQYIEDASDTIVAYINNMTSDKIAEYNQNAIAKTNTLEQRASYLSGVADKTEYIYNNRERIAFFNDWPSNRL